MITTDRQRPGRRAGQGPRAAGRRQGGAPGLSVATPARAGVAAIGGTFALTCLAWAFSSPHGAVPVTGQVSQLLGGLALTGFAALFVIATRWSVLDSLFHGLDKAYVAHRWLGVASISLVVAHVLTHGGAAAGGAPGPGSGHGPASGPWGVLAAVGFVALTVVALTATRISHEAWKAVHRLMAVAYAVGLVHYYRASLYGPWGASPFSVWLDLVNLVGVAAAVYSVLLYERVAFRHTYQVTGLRQVGQGNLEITATATGRALAWRPGQFTFVKIPRLKFGSHPFTIASAPGSRTVQLAIRALGDHTTGLAGALKVGDRLLTTAAHGRFDCTTGAPRQIWVAAGIGITPFRSFLHAGVPPRLTVDLFYSYADQHAAYLDELAAPPDNVRVHLVDTARAGRLTAEQIVRTAAPDQPVDVYFCGPRPMRDALASGLAASPVPVRAFHVEEFGFGR